MKEAEKATGTSRGVTGDRGAIRVPHAEPREGHAGDGKCEFLEATACEPLTEAKTLRELIGDHPSIVRLRESLLVVARGGEPVLIRGEPGTGRSLCARILHALGARPDLPLVSVSCRALTARAIDEFAAGRVVEPPLRSRCFRKALFEVAGGGTLVLEEVDTLSVEAQASLVRLLKRVDTDASASVDGRRVPLRLVSIASRDLDECARQGAFRRDLLDRLAVSCLFVPPLRERGGDVRLLVGHFAHALRRYWRRAVWEISPQAVRVLAQREWPGNVRDLRDAVNRAVRPAGAGQILPVHFDPPSEVTPEARRRDWARPAIARGCARTHDGPLTLSLEMSPTGNTPGGTSASS